MKVVFIRCATESLGIEYLSAALKAAGHETALVYEPLLFRSFRLDIGRLETSKAADTARRILTLNPGLAGFSVESDYYGWALEVASELKKISGIPVVFGGIHPTLVPEKILDHSCVDFVCVGDGEKAVVELADALQRGRGADGIGNIWARSRGGILKNQVAFSSAPDAGLTPDKDLFFDEYPGFISDSYSVITGRGCPNACSYCHNSSLKNKMAEIGASGPRFRRRNPASVLQELKLAKTRYRPRRISFCDDLFISDGAWLKTFLEGYRAQIALPFFCNIHPSFVTDETARLLETSGCGAVNIGVQTASETIRKNGLGRRESNEDVKRALKLLAGRRFFVYANYIFGLPLQDVREIQDTIRFAAENPADFNDVNWLRFYPRSDILKAAVETGRLNAEAVKDIEETGVFRPYAHGGHSYTPETSRLRNLLLLSSFLGPKVTGAFLDFRLYRFLPSVNLRHPLIISRVLALKFFKAKKHPYPNFSLAQSFAYHAHYLLKSYLARYPAQLLDAFVSTLKTFFGFVRSRLLLLTMLTPKAALCYARYFANTRLRGRRIPGTAMILVTLDCQCACAHCSAAIFRKSIKPASLTRADALRRLDEIIELGVPRVHFTGGEPLLWPHLAEMVKLCSDNGITAFVETNGLGADEAKILALRKAGAASLNVSLDSSLAREHDKGRAKEGSYSAALEAIRLCARLGQRCLISAYATPEKIWTGETERLLRFAPGTGAAGLRLLAAVASGNFQDSFEKIAVGKADTARMKKGFPWFYPIFDRTDVVRCALPDMYKVVVLPDSSLAPCEHLPYVFSGSGEMSMRQTFDRAAGLPLFRETTDCWARNRGFRKLHAGDFGGKIVEL